MCCLCLKKYSSLRKKPSFRNKLFFEKSYEKLDKELDVARVLKAIRKFKYLMKILLAKD
jgi:hypothetical protein